MTAFDRLDEMLLGAKPSMAHLMARTEVRALIEAIGLLPRRGAVDRVEGRTDFFAIPPAAFAGAMQATGPPKADDYDLRSAQAGA